MEKNLIKNYAVWARKELIKKVILKAAAFGIEKNKKTDLETQNFLGRILTEDEQLKRKAVVEKIKEYGFDTVMEEVAYTWFNRFIALRFMEVNDCIKTRVFTDRKNNFLPEILEEPLNSDISQINSDRVTKYIKNSDIEGLFGYLIISYCNELGNFLPGMFEKLDISTELLIPDNLLREGSVISKMVEMIPEDDWKNQVQIIGWLYQYYNIELKEEVFTELKKNKKITKDKIPAATQIFTPDWIVKYMVENSLGKLWVESHPDSEIYKNWRYYLKEPPQEKEVKKHLETLKSQYLNIDPENIKCIDPSVGSGHVLCYLFDILIEIYESYGYKRRDAVRLIIEKNLYALDIDKRAQHLAYFSVMMKAIEYDKKFLCRDYIPQPNIYTICESNYFSNDGKKVLEFFKNKDNQLAEIIDSLIEDMYDAKEYGSIINVKDIDIQRIYKRFEELESSERDYKRILEEKLLPLVKQYEILSEKYDVVVTNPPYIGSGGMNDTLTDFIKKNYYVSRGDLFAVFMEKWCRMLKPFGFNAMVTMHSWMFLSGFENFRRQIFKNMTVSALLHMDVMVMGIAFGTCATVFRNNIKNYKGVFTHVKKSDIKDEIPVDFPVPGNRYAEISTDMFEKIPGTPVSFWAGENALKAFEGKMVEDYGIAKSGVQTGDNERFLRFWFEVDRSKIAFGMKDKDSFLKSGKKWIPQIKGGKYKKWYGNFDYIVNWENDGAEIRSNRGCRLNAMAKDEFYFKEGLTWSHTTSGGFGMRYLPQGLLFNVEAPTLFVEDREYLYYILGCLNTEISQFFLDLTNSTQHYLVGNIMKLPLKYDEKKAQEVKNIVKECISLSKADWNMSELSWNFERSPLIADFKGETVEVAYEKYKTEANKRFEKMRVLEERLNEIFAQIYGIHLDKKVSLKDITVTKIFDDESQIEKEMKGNRYILTKADVIKDLISYGVGYISGRYSVSETDKNIGRGLIPVTSKEYFENDIVTEFIKFLQDIFGKEKLEENIEFIGSIFKGKGTARDKIRKYFISDFFKDHCKKYEKRPIYWQFDSGKKEGLKVILYIHSYTADILARIRVDYVHEIQKKYHKELIRAEKRMNSADCSQRAKLNKDILDLKDKIEELEIFEKKVQNLADKMIEMDLDNGVKKNYTLFKEVLTKI